MLHSCSVISKVSNRLEPNSEPEVELFRLTYRSVGRDIIKIFPDWYTRGEKAGSYQGGGRKATLQHCFRKNALSGVERGQLVMSRDL